MYQPPVVKPPTPRLVPRPPIAIRPVESSLWYTSPQVAPPPADKVFGALKEASFSVVLSDELDDGGKRSVEENDSFAIAGRAMAEFEFSWEEGKPRASAEPRLTAFIPLKSMVTALSRLAALAMGVWTSSSDCSLGSHPSEGLDNT